MTRLHRRSIAELAEAIAARRASSVEATEACLARIAADNGRLNAFIAVTAREALAQAREADNEIAAGSSRGPLHGVPISLKDLIDVRGVPTTAGSRALDGHVARTDATVVARLREAGAVFVGKCNLHEFAFGTTSEDSAYGAVRNPFDPTRSPGGSSGGSAAAVAAGMSLASIGTDTGGSIRIPAAVCGCVGLKPTFGELSCEGVIPLSRSLDHVGPIAQTVEDARLLFEAMGGGSPGSARAEPLAPRCVRLGLLRPYFMDVLAPCVRGRFEAAVDRLAGRGVRTRETEVRHAADTAAVYLHLQLPEASAYHATMLEQRPEVYTPPVRQRLELGRYVLAEDYVRAMVGREVLQHDVDRALEDCDALALPTVPITAPPIGSQTQRIDGRDHPTRGLMLRLTQLFDITGHPAISLPCGHGIGNLPVGFQLVGHRDRTGDLLRVAAACEAVLAQLD